MHNLSVGAIFRNERHAIREWIEHYRHHGAEHFYLIDDSSTDDSVALLQPYIAQGVVSLFSENHPRYSGRQPILYTKHILPHLHETRWLLMVDLDEFLWSPRAIDLRSVLAQLDHIAQVQVMHTLFGSNGHVAIPAGGIVESYTRRASGSPTNEPGNYKYFLNSTRVSCSRLSPHTAVFTEKPGMSAPFYIMDESWFVLNHYCCQARELWRQLKCPRGDADEYRVRTMDDFAIYDLNDVEDTRLLMQNRSMD